MKNVYVGMSGGVDSSVTAALCKQQGYDVTGVYMKNWTRDVGGTVCPWREDMADAQSVAAHLDIPFTVFDFEAEYRQLVVDYMLAEYRAGRTPNPDIMCNQEVKFRLFLDTALSEGADMIATGHYSRIIDNGLYTGADTGKDQSYFLYRITPEALSKTVLPLGDYTKSAVRGEARRLGLPTAAKPDSQGICFVGNVSIKEFLSEYIDTEPGPIQHIDGQTLGEHEGAVFYTIGQRKGLDVGGALISSRGGGGLPVYVVDKDVERNIVYVSESLDMLWETAFSVSDLHWIQGGPEPGKQYYVRTRHQGDMRPATVVASPERAEITLEQPERALAPGQSAVVYEETPDGVRVVGGGIITP